MADLRANLSPVGGEHEVIAVSGLLGRALVFGDIELRQRGEASLVKKAAGIAEAFQIGEDLGDRMGAVVPLFAFEEQHRPVAAQHLLGTAENVQLVALDIAFQEAHRLSTARKIAQETVERDHADLDGMARGGGGAGGFEGGAGRGADTPAFSTVTRAGSKLRCKLRASCGWGSNAYTRPVGPTPRASQ